MTYITLQNEKKVMAMGPTKRDVLDVGHFNNSIQLRK